MTKKTRSKLENEFYILYQNKFGNLSGKSYSGYGSELPITSHLRKKIPEILKKYKCDTLIDAPCGDHHWMSKTKLSVKKYVGIDIVPELIERNISKYASEKKSFLTMDISKKIPPRGDIILSRDCFVHLTYKNIFKALKNFIESESTYLLMTHFPEHNINYDLGSGLWRKLNFTRKPFNFPNPILMVGEGGFEPNMHNKDKCLALWKLDDLKL